MEGNSYVEQSPRKVVKKSSRSVSNSLKSVADLKLSRHKIKGNIQKRSAKSTSAPRSTNSVTRHRTTKRDRHMHQLIFKEGGLPDGSEVTYIYHGENLREGYKVGHRIYCFCCNTEVSPSQFEAHAGQAYRKKPYDNIFLSNGESLHQYASSLKLNCERLGRKNDDICTVCQKGEDLLFCHGCPRSFHRECISETNIPLEKWFCTYCQKSMRCLGENANNLAAGRVSGADALEQITKRCIRIIDKRDKHALVACALCRSYDCSENGFNDQSVIVCHQCEKEYHIGCLREHKKADLKELPAGKWFCCVDCDTIHSFLKKLVICGPEKVPSSLMDLIKKWKESDFAVKWILLSGKDDSQESRSLVTEAIDIFHECFAPIVDTRTGNDLIPSMAYGLKIEGGADFGGVHCAMLTIESRVITAGLFRVFGKDIAELPIAATSKPNQGKGYFQLFYTCFERVLSHLNVKKILVPATEEAKSMWTNKLGFRKVTPKQFREYWQSFTSMVSFDGTTLLEKKVRKSLTTFEDGVDFSLPLE